MLKELGQVCSKVYLTGGPGRGMGRPRVKSKRLQMGEYGFTPHLADLEGVVGYSLFFDASGRLFSESPLAVKTQ